MGFGARIKEARGDLSQRRLSELVGASQSAVNDWEHERTTPPLDMFERIAKATGRDAAWLAFGKRAGAGPGIPVDREVLRKCMAAIDRRIAQKVLARATSESRVTMALAIHDLLTQPGSNGRAIDERIERQLDALVQLSE